MGPTWGRQDPGGPHDGHMKLAIWEGAEINHSTVQKHWDSYCYVHVKAISFHFSVLSSNAPAVIMKVLAMVN